MRSLQVSIIEGVPGASVAHGDSGIRVITGPAPNHNGMQSLLNNLDPDDFRNVFEALLGFQTGWLVPDALGVCRVVFRPCGVATVERPAPPVPALAPVLAAAS